MQSDTDTRKTSKTFNPPRLAVTAVAVVATVAALAGPVSASAHAATGGGCPTWMCGSGGNHNEVMAAAAVRSAVTR
jgi:hypothetical protein